MHPRQELIEPGDEAPVWSEFVLGRVPVPAPDPAVDAAVDEVAVRTTDDPVEHRDVPGLGGRSGALVHLLVDQPIPGFHVLDVGQGILRGEPGAGPIARAGRGDGVAGGKWREEGRERGASERDAARRGRRDGRLIEPIVVQHHRGRRLGAGARVGHASPAERAAGGHAHDDTSGDGGAGKAIHIRQVTKSAPRGLEWQRFADVSRFWQFAVNARWIAVGTEGERASLSSDVVIEYFNRI